MAQEYFTDNKGERYWIDGFLVKKMENIKSIIKKNWDCVFLIDGRERSGKSTLGLTLGKYLDPKLSTQNLARGTEDCIKKIGSLPDKSIMIIDEGSLALSSGDAVRTENKKLSKILDVVGQKNMVFIIILPSVFDLQRQIVMRRARFLLHVYTTKDMKRGKYGYYSENQLGKLYAEGKKNNGKYVMDAMLYGRFCDYNPLGEDYFGVKKETLLEALHEGGTELGKREQVNLLRLQYILHFMIKEKKWTNQSELSQFLKQKYNLNISQQVLSNIMGGVQLKDTI